jgi:hypothetical protein
MFGTGGDFIAAKNRTPSFKRIDGVAVPLNLAEAVRFELTEGLLLRRFSRPVP